MILDVVYSGKGGGVESNGLRPSEAIPLLPIAHSLQSKAECSECVGIVPVRMFAPIRPFCAFFFNSVLCRADVDTKNSRSVSMQTQCVSHSYIG
jgi:hypothetical protein